MRFGPINPYTNWPQDTLQVPRASAKTGMPPTEYANQFVSGRESFTYSALFTIPISTPRGTVFSQTLETDQDGDFWCQAIYATGFGVQAGATTNTLIPASLQVTDLRTARQLCYPDGMPLDFLAKRYTDKATAATAGDFAPPSAWRGVGTLPEAFCFTRQGGIQLDLVTQFANFPTLVIEISIGFGGWKEYAHGSGV